MTTDEKIAKAVKETTTKLRGEMTKKINEAKKEILEELKAESKK